MPASFSAGSDRIREPARLAAVAASALLDTPAERAFDDLTRMAATVLDAPFAFATIVDDRRSFWKSAFGIAADAPHENTVEESFCQYVVRSREALFVNDAAADALTCENPSVQSMGVRAWAGFPIRAIDGEVLGSFCVVDVVPRTWSARDMEIIETLAAAATREIALRTTVQREREARTRAEALAHALQQSLLPPTLIPAPGLDVGAAFRPAGTGLELLGDFYDFFALRDGIWAFVVGDVCGKGINAAKVAAFARYVVDAVATDQGDPASVLAWLNDTLIKRSPVSDVFLTAVYGTIDGRSGRCEIRLAGAGHPSPIVRKIAGTAELVNVEGPLLGVFESVEITETRLTLAPGDALVIYTDGVDEARRGDRLLGTQALLDFIASAGAQADATTLARRIERHALDFAGGVASDDIAVLVIGNPANPA